MAKRVTAIALVLLTACLVYAQELEISGEVKTGFFWQSERVDGKKAGDDVVKMHNNDDAGDNEGRFRLNLHLHNDLKMGMRIRFERTVWTSAGEVRWTYAMAYGNFLDEQLRISIGRLGESPWGASGPDIWKDLDDQYGIRTEIMPKAIPGLDIGFVINGVNASPYERDNVSNFLTEILKETVFGVAYTNSFFHGRFAWRLDSDWDVDDRDLGGGIKVEDNMEMIYRLEERIIRQYLPGFSIFAVGYWRGIGEDEDTPNDYSTFNYRNYLYIDYSPEAFSSRLGLGLITTKGVHLFKGRASFYYNIFPILSAGAAFNYEQFFGEYAPNDGKAFSLWGVEPQVRVSFNPNAYVAFVYFYGQQWGTEGVKQVLKDRQWINLRAVYTF